MSWQPTVGTLSDEDLYLAKITIAALGYDDVAAHIDALTAQLERARGIAVSLEQELADMPNRIAAAIAASFPYNCELRYDGTEDPHAAAYVEGMHNAYLIAETFTSNAAEPTDQHALDADGTCTTCDDKAGVE